VTISIRRADVARVRKHPTQAAKPGGEGQLVEHEYERKGALCYLAAWDARQADLGHFWV
jgi:hypothetical protein